MILLSAPHPPAAGTALIVSMGTMTHWDQSAALIGGLFLLAGQALLINRLAGLRFPIWAPYASDGRTMVAHAVEPGEAVPTITLYGNAASDLGLPGSSARAEAEGPPARNGS